VHCNAYGIPNAKVTYIML